MKTIKKFMRDEEGAAAVEYGLLVALIAVVIIASVRALGVTLDTVFTTINTALTPVATP